MTNEEINNYLRLAIMEEVNKRMGKNFECIYDLCDYAKNLEKENKQLKAQIEKMKCCENCDGWDYISTGERDCIETCCSNRSNWRLRDRS